MRAQEQQMDGVILHSEYFVFRGEQPLQDALDRRFSVRTGHPSVRMHRGLDPREEGFQSLVESCLPRPNPPEAGSTEVSLVLPIFQAPLKAENEMVDEVFIWTQTLQLFKAVLGFWPRHLVALHPYPVNEHEHLASATLKTLMRYTCADLVMQQLAVNIVRYPRTSLGAKRAADTAYALTSGWMNDMNAQVLELTDH
jgi:hypothetical protein